MKRKALTLLLLSWLTVSTLRAIRFTQLAEAKSSSIIMAPIEQAYIRSNVAADAANGVDQSSLSSPISISFEPLFSLPSPTPILSPTLNPQSNLEPFPTLFVVAASGASVVTIGGLGLVVYFQKRRHQTDMAESR